MLLIDCLRKIRNLGSPVVRDFTKDAQNNMVAISKRVNEQDQDDGIVDSFVGQWLDKKGLLEFIFAVEKYQKTIIDYYDYGANDIKEICEEARRLDRCEGNKIDNVLTQSKNVIQLMKSLNNCFDTNSKNYPEDWTISERLLDYNNDDEEAAQWKSQNIQIELGKDDILSYCSDEDNMSLFDNYTDYIYNDVMDWSTLDIAFLSAGTVLYKGVEMTVDDLLAILSKEGYSEKQIRAQFDSIIASVISANQNVSLTVKEWKIAQDTVEELCKDYLNDKNKNSAFKSFVEMIGGIDAIKELNKTAPQLIDYLFSDYSNGFKIIESLKEDCNTGSEMYKAISELESKYRSKWLGVIGSVTDYNETMIAKIVDNDIKKWLKKECGQYSVITSFLEGTNLETKTDAAHALVAQRKIHEELKHKYEILFNKFNSGNYDDGDVEAFKNVFNLLKENTKEMYKTCLSAKAGDVSTQIKINQEISKIDNLEITRIPQSYAETGVLTYEG